MTQTEKQNVPKLRFPGFENEWREKTLEDHFTALDAGVSVNSGDRPAKGSEKGILKTSAASNGIFDSKENKYVYDVVEINRLKEPVQADTIIFSRMNTPQLVGENAYVDRDVDNLYLPDRLWAAKPKKDTSMRFISYIVCDGKTRKMIADRGTGTSGSMKNISKNDVFSIEIQTPTLPEQQKIASFLGSVDEKITQLSRKKALLEDYKKGCMQQIFSQKIRFKDDQGNDFPDWEEKRLADLFERIRQKNNVRNENVLTISAQAGLVNQLDYFNHSVAAKDTSGYYLLEKGDFAYNKSYSKGYPMGAIKRLKHYDQGVVSTLYICFRPKNSEFGIFYECYFDSGFQNRWLAKITQEGARNHGLLNMAIDDVFDMHLPFPHPDEQRKIADFLSALDTKIDLVAQELEHARTFKKGLLQQMFV